jgi:anti-sigma regulatory factor (Ser/Thr protein kinase)
MSATSQPENRLERRFPRRLDSLETIYEFVRVFFADHALDEESMKSVNLAVEELFTNMFKYSVGESEISIVLERLDREVAISLTDYGVAPYDITKVPEIKVDKPLDERKPGGLGIHLIKKLMDRVEYEYADRRSTTTFYKKIEE